MYATCAPSAVRPTTPSRMTPRSASQKEAPQHIIPRPIKHPLFQNITQKVRPSLCARARTHTHTHTQIQTHTAHTYTCTSTHETLCAHTHTHAHAQTHNTHCAHTYAHTHTHARTCIHTHTHVHPHTRKHSACSAKGTPQPLRLHHAHTCPAACAAPCQAIYKLPSLAV